MSRLRDKRIRAGHRGLAAAAIALAVCLAVPGAAAAGQDELKGGSVDIQLAGSHGLKLSPRSLHLAITGGAVDPINGSGTVEVAGRFRIKRGKRTSKVKVTGLTFGADGGAGSIAAKVGKRKVGRFGILSGGQVSRDGWGARITGVTATLGAKGSKALVSAKGGQRLGTVSATTVPRSVEVLPGGTLVFSADNGFANKLLAHCVTPLGVGVIPPATQNLTVFTFPVTGGSVSPDFDAGTVVSGGGQTITKDSSLPVPFTCNQGPPVGTKITQTEFQAQFELQALASFTVLPDGPVGIGALGKFDLGPASKSADPVSKQVTISDAPVHLDLLSAFILNQVLPNESGDPNNDFREGDLLGTMSLSVKTH
ncbi:MAG: hypothetical protein ACJ75Z_09425 [Solirubrobacterales bacterium]